MRFAVGLIALGVLTFVDVAKWTLKQLPRTFGQGPRRDDEYLP